MSLTATIYARPKRRTQEIEITHIRPEDEAWFKEKGYPVSLEEAGPVIIVYVDYGERTDEGEPIELIHIVPQGQTCEVAFSIVREKLIKLTGQ